jgi:Spy/CpxP family protein refolding chaperone
MFLGIVMMGCLMTASCFAQETPALKGGAAAPSGEVKTIFSFKKEISLTDDQENKIKAILYDDQSLLTSYRSKLSVLGSELSEMISKKENMKVVKSKLEEISKVQVEMTCRDIENSRKIDAILTPDQIEKWKAIKEKALSQGRK